jgi:hypothetical protein
MHIYAVHHAIFNQETNAVPYFRQVCLSPGERSSRFKLGFKVRLDEKQKFISSHRLSITKHNYYQMRTGHACSNDRWRHTANADAGGAEVVANAGCNAQDSG